MKGKRKFIWLLVAVMVILNVNPVFAAKRKPVVYHSINAQSMTDNPRILFVGNSHTSRNKMPETFRRLCLASGINAKVKTVAYSGHSISRYVFPFGKKDKQYHDELFGLLKNQTWDYIILQGKLMETEQSLRWMKAGIREIQNTVSNTDAQIVLFMPPEAKNPAKAGHRNITTDRLYRAYCKLAKEYQIALAPVSAAYSRVKKVYPKYELYHKDGIHPSKMGSYLTACTIYATLFDTNVEKNKYRGKLPKKKAANLRKVAGKITTDPKMR